MNRLRTSVVVACLAMGAALAAVAASPAALAAGRGRTPQVAHAPAIHLPRTAGGLTYVFQNWPGLPKGAGAIWDDNGQARTSHTYSTPLTVSSLAIGPTIQTETQLVTPTGACLGPINNGGTWYVDELSATQCANDVPRSVILIVLVHVTPAGALAVRQIITGSADPDLMAASPVIFPMALVLYLGVWVNLMLTFFNLLPLPPLDGSHIFRHMLPYNALRVYDSMGMISLILMLFLGAPLVNFFVAPALGIVNAILLSI